MSVLSESDLQLLERKLSAAAAAKKITASTERNLVPWLHDACYAEFVPQLRDLILREEYAELDRLFWERIPFGTGGRRGPMAEFGSATINRRTIAESAYGLAVYVQQAVGEKSWRAVVACDTRNRSQEFARVSACVLAAQGYQVFCFRNPRATPELSFAVRHLECDTGIMISASHNPPADNGFKAYWSTGGQVLSPHDKGIISCVESAREIPQLDFDAAVQAGKIQFLDERIDQAYIQAVASLSLSPARDITALFTPLHGVGETSVYRVIQQAGFSQVRLFGLQATQDGNFPHVPNHLPNPERPEVFCPAIDAAQGTDASLILASDPDADRLAVAVRDASGSFHTLSGNQLGSLLTDYILRKRTQRGTLSPKHYVVETLVTTPMIAAIARSYGVRAIDNLLVGFKYIGATMDAEGPEHFVFGTEESLGYLAGAYARDKDAAVAGLYALELAAELRESGQTLLDRLDELHAMHGVYLEDQLSLTRPGAQGNQEIARLMATFREQPPEAIGDLTLHLVRDYLRHEIRKIPGNQRQGDLPEPAGDVLIAEGVANGCQIRIAARPSGTEPKIKFYLFAHSPASAGTVERTRDRASGELSRTRTALQSWADAVCHG